MSCPYQIDYPDAHHVRAAEGWLELGNHMEAQAALKQITPAMQIHPEVLLLKWQICVRTGKWDCCFALAEAVIEILPGDPRGWIALGRTFYYSGGTGHAYIVATSKIGAFPNCWQLLYDIARFACRLGRRREALRSLERAMKIGDAKTILRRAQEDPDLRALARSERDSSARRVGVQSLSTRALAPSPEAPITVELR